MAATGSSSSSPARCPAAGNIRALTDHAIAIRTAANAQGVGGEKGEPIDHVIFQGPSPRAGIHSRNFVLCPDDTYDRSPCGTGSSARLACLAAAGRLQPGEEIIQESIIGSPYRLSYQPGQRRGDPHPQRPGLCDGRGQAVLQPR